MNYQNELADSLENTFDVNNISPEIRKEILTDASNAMKFCLEKLILDVGLKCDGHHPKGGCQLEQLRDKWL